MSWGDELLRRAAEDQEARTALVKSGLVGRTILAGDDRHEEFTALAVKMREVDERNGAWFRVLVDNFGWPRVSEVGRDGAQSAWLLAQHADADPAFKRVCLDLANALPEAEVDRVRECDS